MRPPWREGFTIAELLFAIVVGGLLVLAVVRLTETVERVGEAGRSGSDARALARSVERALRRTLEEAGDGIPASPNLAGVGVRRGAGPDGEPADTLVVLRGDGEAMAVAARPCRDGVPACVALVGDRRSAVAAGDVVLVGTRAGGLAALQLTAAPALFHAPCGADCPERLVCTAVAGPARSFPRIVGSVREPGGVASPAPCAQAFLPDGSRCEEVAEPAAATPARRSCRLAAEGAAFTELRVADRTAALGFPAPPSPLRRSGTEGTPRVRAVRVRAARLWVRPGAQPSMVRQDGLDGAGLWRAAVPVAGPVSTLGVETLHGGAWHPGVGVDAADLLPDPANPNYAWLAAPGPEGGAPGARFLRGHHTISAVRVRTVHGEATAAHGLSRTRDAWTVVATPALLDGGTGDPR